MELEVIRFTPFDRKSSLGLFMTDGRFTCFTLEDPFHIVKIPGETRIQNGRYRVRLRTYGGHHEKYKIKFPGFHKGMLEIVGVPNYTDILIHIGNFVTDTDGCLIVGDVAVNNISQPDVVKNSTIAYKRMYIPIANAIESGEEVWITYREL